MPKISKTDADKLLANVSEDRVFWCHDGRVLRSLRELGEALKTMSGETYAHHVRPDNNDFANWTRDVFGDRKLASDLAKAADRAEAARIVGERLSTLAGK